jgi:hypothetical protein
MASQVSLHVVSDSTSIASISGSGEIARLERCIANAERHLEEQESRLRQAMLEGGNTAVHEFDLQKMQLLLAILREGRDRVAQQLDTES